MTALPTNIRQFITQHHVVSLAVQHQDAPWCACCFYVFDEPNQRLIILTSSKTLHGKLMLEHPQLAGTIAGQPEKFTEIAGIQLLARAERLQDQQRQHALDLYTQKHPIAHLAEFAKVEVWALWLTQIKYTENKYLFAQKTKWQRE